MSAPSEKGLIQSVDRALRILELFHRTGNAERSIKEISAELDLNKSTAHGLLQTLKAHGFIAQNPENSKYGLGYAVMEMGMSLYDGLDLGRVARPYLEALVRDWAETAHLVVRDGDHVVYIDKIEATNSVGIISHIGKRNPIHCTGLGKSILAHCAPEIRAQILARPLTRYTEHTITDPAVLEEELAQIRRQGYSIDREEIERGLSCVAAPVFNHSGEVVGAISLAGPTTRMHGERLIELADPVRACADAISRQFGHQPKRQATATV